MTKEWKMALRFGLVQVGLSYLRKWLGLSKKEEEAIVTTPSPSNLPPETEVEQSDPAPAPAHPLPPFDDQKAEGESLRPVGTNEHGNYYSDYGVDILPRKERKDLLRFGAGTGFILVPSHTRPGVVLLLPPEYGKAKNVALVGPRGSISLKFADFANPAPIDGFLRAHYRIETETADQLNRRLGRVGTVSVVVDDIEVKVPNRLDERND